MVYVLFASETWLELHLGWSVCFQTYTCFYIYNSIYLYSCFKFQAAVSGLQNQPIINAVIDGDDIIYRDYIDISIAVGTKKASLNSLI